MTTQDRVRMHGTWPTKGQAAQKEFVGDAECAKCHSEIARTQAMTAMGGASSSAEMSQILQKNPYLRFHSGAYEYGIRHGQPSFQLSVSDGGKSLAAPLSWAFGLGNKGQTYLYSQNGSWYESRVSFYNTLQGLDVTTGNLSAKSYSLADSLGRVLDAGDVQRCFGCHTSQSTTSDRFHPESATAGVRCESCHGPGAKHVAAMKAGNLDAGRKFILNPTKLSPVESVDFCGACHRTWGDVVDEGIVGVANVRFQPYRLENSRCWGKGDDRLTCIACHNPHEELVHDPGFYGEKCLRCHVTGKEAKISKDHPGRACPVSSSNCVSCHMPKVEIPSMHARFTDHFIRVVPTETR
jgi:Cytochrome c554 and c-prime